MSTWIDVKKYEDIEYTPHRANEDMIDIYIGSDDFGNNYVSVPVRLIIEVLRENGYEVR